MVSFWQDHSGGQTPGVQEGKQEDGLGNDCGGPDGKGWGPGVARSQVRSCFNSVFYFLVFPPFTSC